MQTRRLDGLQPVGWPAPSVAVGNFDGVHRGHQALLAAAHEAARTHGGCAAALTFDPHPAQLLHPEAAPDVLMSLERKARLLADLGLERLGVLTFDRVLAGLDPEEFARRVLRDCLGARRVIVGRDFRFGRGRSGDAPLLERLGARLGFEVQLVDPVLHAGAPISSTRVRAALARGAVEEAAALIGRPHLVEGPVVAGDARGRTLGFPTANLEPRSMLPAAGVYACLAGIDGAEPARPAVVNIGRRPTFGGREVRAEAHLLDFDDQLYDRELALACVARLRPERRFEGREALVEQIARDVAAARAVLE